MHWELVEPIPGSGTPGDEAHLKEVQTRLDHYTALLPGFDGGMGLATIDIHTPR